MFTLQDGREHLYQWDLDRYILVNDPKISEVHFCNRTTDCSLVVEVKDGLAAIPNIILQDARPIRAYAYVDDKYTLVEQQFTVKSRTRPADYIYTETEVKRWEDLAEKAEAAVADAEAAVKEAETAASNANKAIEDFQGQLDGLATEEYVTDAIADIDIPDISNLATKTELDTKLNRCTTNSSIFNYVTVSNYRNTAGSFIPVENMNYDATTSKDALARRDNNAQIRVPVTPTQDYHAASKAYVDGSKGNYLSKATNSPSEYNWYVTGSNSTQTTQVFTPMERMEYPLDHDLGFNANTIPIREGQQLRVPTVPTSDNHAASKAYVDSAIPDVSAFQTEAQVIALIEQYGGGGGDYPNFEEVEF